MSKIVLFLFVAICAMQILSKPAAAAPLYDVSGETTEDPMEAFNQAMEKVKSQLATQMEELLQTLGKNLPEFDIKEKTKE